MDTLTHALSGALIGRALAAPNRARRALPERWFGPPLSAAQAVAVGAVAAAFPDIDFVLNWVSDLAYLRGHRGVTHSVLLLPLWSVLLGFLFALLFRRRELWKRAGWIAASGLALHIVGDWITQFGTMLLAPLSDARFGLGSIFIIDLVLTGIVVAGLLGSLLVRSSRVPAVVALALLPMWVGVSLVGRAEALRFARAYADREGIAARMIDAAPRPASPFNWTVVVFDGAQYRYAHVNTRRGEPLKAGPDANFIRRFSAPYQPLALAEWQSALKVPEGPDAALARAAWSHPEFEFFRWFAQFPVFDRIDRGADGECVWFKDLRFLTPGRDEMPFRYGMCRLAHDAWRPFRLDGDAGRVGVH
ncbi:MAG: metal-dependent hydrolase [Burkholderiaceae bacterium]